MLVMTMVMTILIFRIVISPEGVMTMVMTIRIARRLRQVLDV